MALLCMGLFSCEKRHVDDNMYDPSVYIINNGLQTETLYDVEGKSHSFTVNTYCAGYKDLTPNVRLVYNQAGVLDAYNQENGTSYRLLPENCYKLDSRHKVMDDSRIAFTVTFDCDKIAALSKEMYYDDIQDYVIPYTVVSETEGVTDARVENLKHVFIKPEMHKMAFEFHAPASKDVIEDEEGYSMQFNLQTVIQNKWESGYEIEWELTDADGIAVDPANYILTCSSPTESFVSGVSEITYGLKLLKSGGLDAVNVRAAVGRAEGGFDYIGKDVYNWKFEVNAPLSKAEGAVPGFERTREKGDVCGNWLNDNNNPYKLINGVTGSDYWGWNWNKRPEGGVRPEDESAEGTMGAGHPYAFIFDLSATVDVSSVSLWRSSASESNWKALGAGYVEFSTDRTTWTGKVEFDFADQDKYPYTGQNNNIGPLEVPNETPVNAKYIRLTLTKNWYGPQVMGDNLTMGAAFSEIDVYLPFYFSEVTE